MKFAAGFGRLRYAILALFVTGTCATGAVAQKKFPIRAPTYEDQIKGIVASAADAEELEHSLPSNIALKELQARPMKILADADRYLRSHPNAHPEEIWVAVLSLQCLEIHEYLAFLDRLARLPKGKLSSWALYYGAVPGEDWSIRLELRFKDREVQETLKRVSASPNADARVKIAVGGILSGATAKYDKEHGGEQGLECVRIHRP